MQTFIPALVLCAVAGTAAPLAAQTAPAAAAVTITKASVSADAANDSRQALMPPPGRAFLRVSVKVAGAPATIDLTKVAVTDGPARYAAIGADAMWDGDPKEFSMIAPSHLKSGKAIDPIEETKSAGSIAFAFKPGAAATVKVTTPPQSFCLLFEVPATMKGGQVVGLGSAPIALPAITAGR
jgi:hypothetical protein